MDELIDQYIQNLITSCLNSQFFLNLTADQKTDYQNKLLSYFTDLVNEETLNHLTDDQITQLQTIPPESSEFQLKMEEFASNIPNLAQDLEQKLTQSCEQIKQTGQIPQVQ